MLEHRITKYDPSFRDARGAYMRDEWTSITDVGRCFTGAVFSREEYQRIEDAYVAVALGFMREVGQAALAAVGLENHARHSLDFDDGDVLRLEHVEGVIRRVLREDFWCRLEAPNAFIHFGHDYYMYVGVHVPCPETGRLARELGLFVEDHHSPYQPAAAWIRDAASRLRLTSDEIVTLDHAASNRVASEAGRRFVVDPGRGGWWEGLQNVTASLALPDDSGFRLVTELVPTDVDRVLLVVPTPNRHFLPWPTFDVDRESLREVLRECPPFEYYVLPRDLDWLVCHRDRVVVAIGSPVAERLRGWSSRDANGQSVATDR